MKRRRNTVSLFIVIGACVFVILALLNPAVRTQALSRYWLEGRPRRRMDIASIIQPRCRKGLSKG
ncbi:MAG: hypothetical protein JW795_04730 [Chitinivibrionales bacterium]|nr:hypothetical protein [Chitinivibrionales bacterium]